jgi:hypothetical protein
MSTKLPTAGAGTRAAWSDYKADNRGRACSARDFAAGYNAARAEYSKLRGLMLREIYAEHDVEYLYHRFKGGTTPYLDYLRGLSDEDFMHTYDRVRNLD